MSANAVAGITETEHFVVVAEEQKQKEPELPPIPLWERSYAVECKPCNRKVHFQLKAVHASYKTVRSILWGTCDQFRIKCDACMNYIDVAAVLPAWTHRHL